MSNPSFKDATAMQSFSELSFSGESGLFGDYVRDTQRIRTSTPDYKDVDDYDDSLNESALRLSSVFKSE